MTEASGAGPAFDGAPFEGMGVIYFGNDWHAENRTSSHHVALRLARRMPLLYVDSPGMRAPSASGRDVKRALRKLAASIAPPKRVGENLWHCTVPQLPFRRIPGVSLFNRVFGRWAVHRAARLAGIGARRMSWFALPHPGFLAGRLGEQACVYYCIDDYAAHPGVDAATIAACDDALSRRADVLFVAPPALLEPKRRLNANVVPAPHGVDADLFAQACDPATDVPALARDLPSPVVGYVGSLHEWIDVPLLEWLARERPHYSFLMVGHAHVPLDGLRALPNVRLAGAQPYAALPRWLKAFNVALIPYRLNRQVAHANPLKLREYLAAGRPVVSVRNPEIEKFAHLVRIADGHAAFLAALDAAVAEGPGDTAPRRAAVADQSWERRVDDALAAVRRVLRRPPPSSLAPSRT